MKKRPLRVGFDFDGVIAYSPVRIFRAPIALFKRHVLGIRKLSFFYPKNRWQELLWIAVHESSMFPANGVELLRQLTRENLIEAHLITGRYHILDTHLMDWLNKYKLIDVFKTISINRNDEQPHLFKEKMIRKSQLAFFIEDNWDIVQYLNDNGLKNIYWIYNITDRFVRYPKKYPYLKRALEDLINKSVE